MFNSNPRPLHCFQITCPHPPPPKKLPILYDVILLVAYFWCSGPKDYFEGNSREVNHIWLYNLSVIMMCVCVCVCVCAHNYCKEVICLNSTRLMSRYVSRWQTYPRQAQHPYCVTRTWDKGGREIYLLRLS